MYKVQLEKFTGPLDLLLKLIENEELDITQVSLARVADQYLEYMRQIKNLAVQDMTEFLEIAARLILIKSKALLPQLELTDEEELSAEDLALRLKEYKKFREAGKKLRDLLDEKRYCFDRQIYFKEERVFASPPKISVGIIRGAFAKVLGEVPVLENFGEEVMTEVVSLEDKIEHIRGTVEKRVNTFFHKLCDSKEKVEVIVTFLAMLELMKQCVIDVRQKELFGEIELYKVD
ncbi:MAG: Chromosome segregation and condensation protein [uncultured bacterium]|nr:MAG: Chromosome segregation and condensation protein [uncultured bacterium]